MADDNPDKQTRINFRSGTQKIIFRKNKQADKPITNPDGTPVRNKDNVAPQVKPSYARRSAPNLAPPGMMGIRQRQQHAPERPAQPEQQPPKFAFRSAALNIESDIKSEGLRLCTGQLNHMPGYSFMAQVNDKPSAIGLNGGKIDRLIIMKNEVEVARYGHGRWIGPEPQTPSHKEAVQRVRNGLGDSPQKPFKGYDKKPDKDHGFDL